MGEPAAAGEPAVGGAVRRLPRGPALAVLALALALAWLVALGTGAARVPPARVVEVLLGALRGEAPGGGDALILLGLRLPRALAAALVGASLATAGALMQGLFRNPLADPGLVGVSSGAALAAALTIVLGDRLLAPLLGPLPFAALPVAAFAGGLGATALLARVATREGRTDVALMLLAGVALASIAGAMLGLLTYLSDDRQLRDLAFWSLGSLSGVGWAKAGALAALALPALLLAPRLARPLNALSLGEAEAYHLGVDVQRAKRACVLLVALLVGASVAVAGPVGFLGLVVPHLARLALGPDHRAVIPAGALLGAALLVAADALARALAAPAELPLGLFTAAAGAPAFLWLLLRDRGRALA